MTRPNAEEAARLPIPTDHEVQERVEFLLERANRRQWWTLYLDDSDTQLPLIMPMADYPASPDVPAPDGRTAARFLADQLAWIAEEHGASQLVFVWERRGSPESRPDERAWARALSEACRAEGVSVRAQFILHDGGARWFAPDDYA